MLLHDIDLAVEYYNSVSNGLGFEFTDILDKYLQKITRLPSASAIRYDNVRVKPMSTFLYTIHFVIANEATVIILRIFNTYQKPVD